VAVETSIRQAGLGRVAIGGSLLAKPDLAYSWIGAGADDRGAQTIIRALAVRDLVIGVGIAATAGEGASARGWLAAGVASDAVDFAATLGGPDAPGKGLALAVAAGSTLAGLVFLLAAR